MRPKTFDLLCYLVANPGRVLTKDELLDAVWPRTIVTEDSLTQCVRDARRCIGDEGQIFIRTVPRRGYLYDRTTEHAAFSHAALVASASSTAEPMVAILPFRVAGIDDATKGLFDGVAEEIINALSYFKTIAVLSWYSTSALTQGNPLDMREIAERFGVDYLVESSVEDSSPLINVMLTLTETKSSRRVWAHTIPFDPQSVFQFQKEVARRIVASLASTIENVAMRRVSPAPANNVEAYMHLLRGIALLRSYGDDVNEQARAHLEQAVALDSDCGLAFAYLALAETIIGGYGLASDQVLSRALEQALQGISLSPDEARCHRILALVLLYRGEFDASEKHFSRALELNPYDADTLAQMGFLQGKRGRAEEGLRLLDRAAQLNPMHPPWYDFDRGETLFCLDRYEEAARSFNCLPRKDPWHWSRLAAAYALAGDLDRAAQCVKQAGASADVPEIDAVVRDTAYELPEDRQRLRRGLVLAGWDSHRGM